MRDLVLIDTCVWATFFAKPNSVEVAIISDLLDEDRVALIGPILAEVVIGIRRKDHADWVAARLRCAHYLELAWQDWRVAADLGRSLAALGHKLPVPDLALAAVALRWQVPIYTTDPHFDQISHLRRYPAAR